jgi:hypothetical protein
MNLTAILASVGFMLGVLTGAGAVYGAPVIGLRAVQAELTKAQGAAAGHQAAFTDAEGKRETEYADGVLSYEAGRNSCEARLSACEARRIDLFDRMTQGCPDVQTPLSELPVRPVRILLDPAMDDG